MKVALSWCTRRWRRGCQTTEPKRPNPRRAEHNRQVWNHGPETRYNSCMFWLVGCCAAASSAASSAAAAAAAAAPSAAAAAATPVLSVAACNAVTDCVGPPHSLRRAGPSRDLACGTRSLEQVRLKRRPTTDNKPPTAEPEKIGNPRTTFLGLVGWHQHRNQQPPTNTHTPTENFRNLLEVVGC